MYFFPWEINFYSQTTLRADIKIIFLQQQTPCVSSFYILKEQCSHKIIMCSSSVHPRSGWVCFFIRFVGMSLSNGCSAVNGCRQNESQWMHCNEWVPSEWELMDALQWMGAIRMRVNGCSAVNGCRQNESQWMLCSEWVPSKWESDKKYHTSPVHQLTSGEDQRWN